MAARLSGGIVARPTSGSMTFVAGEGSFVFDWLTKYRPPMKRITETMQETGKPTRNQSGEPLEFARITSVFAVPPGSRSSQRGQEIGDGVGTAALQKGQVEWVIL